MSTPDQRLSLAQRYPKNHLQDVILPRSSWIPYPKAINRDGWETIPAELRQTLVGYGEEVLLESWPILPASLYREFVTIGNRTNFEKPYFQRRDQLSLLVAAECCEGKGRFVQAIIDAAWSICEESSWCLPAHVGGQRAGVGLPDVLEPTVDLFSAETAGILAWVVYLVGDQLNDISPLITRRLELEIDLRVLTPALERDDFWWMGFSDRIVNNWNPWINSNWLVSVLLAEGNEERRISAVSKILSSLDRFLAVYPADGGCDEGPSYWGRAGASLFDNLELLFNASDGKIDVYSDPLVKNIGSFISRAHISDDYYLNFADASAVVIPDTPVIWQYGRRTGQAELTNFGSWLAQRNLRTPTGQFRRPGRHSDFSRLLLALFTIGELEHGSAQPALLQDVWLPETQVMAARDQAGSAKGLYLAAKGGHNDESHNHNDVGHFVIYQDGLPVIVDIGVETYSRKTFSDERYSIWTMQSAYHSLPTIDGVMQQAGRHFAAQNVTYAANDQRVVFGLDLAKAYPAEAGVTRWLRRLTLERGKAISLEETFDLQSSPQSLTLSFMTPCLANLDEAGRVVLSAVDLPDGRRSGSLSVFYQADSWKVTVDEIPIRDARLSPVWGDRLFRLVFHYQSHLAHGGWMLKFH